MEKKYDHQLNEAAIQQLWQSNNTYSMENNPGPLFSIDTPPPTVSGTLHIGHIFSYTQTDIIARYNRMIGNCVFYPFGFDDNGLPTERYVEKKRNIRGHEIPRSEFINICIEESHQAADTFKKLWQKMGLSADLDKTYSTISADSRKISQESFIKLFEKNYIYRKQEPALYCTTCRTSVAQAELDDQEMPSFFNDIIFKDNDGNDLIIATTRPELLPACVAVLYNPHDIRYTHLRNKKAIVPLFGQSVPLLEDELVSIEKGSGLVMVCTFGDKTDIIWYKKHNLPYRSVIGLDGKCTDNAGFLHGLKVAQARTTIIEKLKENNLLIRQQAISHSVSVHERCKKEIEFTVLPQWFINILPHKEKFLEIAKSIEWYPAFMKSRYDDWVSNLAWDWGISRQRFYGIPFPAWHCNDCGKILLAQVDQLPIDPQETPYTQPCSECSSTNITPDTDVMDTWNTSSLTPYICHDLFQKITASAILRYTPTGHSGRAEENLNPHSHSVEQTHSHSAEQTHSHSVEQTHCHFAEEAHSHPTEQTHFQCAEQNPNSAHSIQYAEQNPNSIHSIQCAAQNPNSIHSIQCTAQNSNSIHSIQCAAQNSNSIHSIQCAAQNPNSIHSIQCAAQNPNSIHSIQCAAQNSNSAHSIQYAEQNPNSAHPECFCPQKCIEGHVSDAGPARRSLGEGWIPMSMRPQAHDIIRTWAFDTIVKTWMHNETIPWQKIVISGHVLSDKKEKLSKKDANTMDPILLLQKYPADAIRYWTASAKLGQDTMFSEEQLNIGQKLITKLWNAFKFAEPHLAEFTSPDISPQDFGAANKWLLHTISICFEKYQNYFKAQEFGLALNEVEQFFWNDFCDNYIELIKNQLFNPELYTADQVYATRWTLYHAGLRILQLYAPYIPHVTETIYQELYKKQNNINSLHQTHYNTTQTPYVFESEAEIMTSIINLTAQVRKLKSEQQLSLKTPLAIINVFTTHDTFAQAIAGHDQLIRGVTQAIKINYTQTTNETSCLTLIDNEWHANIVLK